METTIQILIADPNEESRSMLADAIRQEPDMQIAGMASDGQEALALAESLQPDILLTELLLTKLDGLSLLTALSERDRSPAAIIHSSFFNERSVAACAELGAYYSQALQRRRADHLHPADRRRAPAHSPARRAGCLHRPRPQGAQP